jgi:hypothetical protein
MWNYILKYDTFLAPNPYRVKNFFTIARGSGEIKTTTSKSRKILEITESHGWG